MSNSLFFALIFLVCLGAGVVGALTGLGGGVVLVPVLVLVFGCDIHYAAGASLISVIATSSGAAAAYLRDGYSNLRIAMFLELATTCGAMLGAYLAGRINGSIISIVFGLVLIFSAWTALHKKDANLSTLTRDKLSQYLKLEGSYPVDGEQDGPLLGHPGGAGLLPHVCGRGCLRIFGHWLGGTQSIGHGSDNGAALQGFHHHQ